MRIPATSTSHNLTLVGFGSAKSGPRKCLTVDTFCTIFYRDQDPRDKCVVKTVVMVDKDKKKESNKEELLRIWFCQRKQKSCTDKIFKR